jgi:hypothetical protein
MHKGVLLVRPLVYIAASLLACAGIGCGSTVATSTGPSPSKCAVTLGVPASPVTSDGATATVAVTTQAECAWSASSDAAWITGLTPSSGQGSGQLQLQVAANPDGTARQGDIVVNNERGRIRQDPAPCRFELATTELTVPASGGNGSIGVNVANGCAWTAQPGDGWITLTGGTTGNGAGTVRFTIGPNNATTTRTAAIVIGGQSVKITQQGAPPPPLPTPPTPTPTPTPPAPPTPTTPAPTPVDCSVTATPRDFTFPASGAASSSIAVSVASTCEWSAFSNVSWITLTGRTSGAGNGTLTFSVAANSGTRRTAVLTIGNLTVPITQEAGAVSCSYTVNPLNPSVAAAGGAGPQISVTTQTGCGWNAGTNETWLTITAGANSSGNGSVAFTAAANTGPARTGTLTVAGQTVTVSQAAAAAATCSVTINPTSVSVAATGSTGTSVAVSAGNGCAWNTVNSLSWVSVTAGASGSGNGTVTFNVSANSGTARNGTFTIGGQTFTVNQAAAPCSYSVTPTTLSVGASGGAAGPVNVTAGDGCPWTAAPSASASWLTVSAGASGSGNGTVSINAAANTGGPRTGTLTIANQTVTVNQAAGQCSFSATPQSVSISAAGGTGTPISVSTGAGCTWTASRGSVSWISILTGATGAGPGTVTYTVQPNTGPARTTTLTVAGQQISVTQASGCVYALSSTTNSFEKDGGTNGRVSVVTATGCPWTAASNTSWITVTSGASGNGNGTVAFSVAANNTGANPNGSLTIAGQPFTVTQKK